MRAITIKELIAEELQRQLAPEGIVVVTSRPKPALVTQDGNVVELKSKTQTKGD